MATTAARDRPARQRRTDHLIHAALLHGRGQAILTGIHALRCYGLDNVPDPADVHLLVPASSASASAGFVHIERTTRLPSSRIRQDLPVAPPHRAALDAARRLSDYDAVLALLAEAVQGGRCTVQALAAELDRGSPRGAKLPRRALIPLLGGARSVAEADAWHLWQRSGLPPCQWNVKLFDVLGRYIATPDAWCEEVAFAWEIDSLTHHVGYQDLATTMARNTRYTTAGVVVLQTLPARLRTEPGKVLAELQAAYEIARGRPRPDVHIR